MVNLWMDRFETYSYEETRELIALSGFGDQ